MKPITVLGGGAWGTAVATLLATNGHRVTIWCYEPDVVETINKQHKNERYLPDVELAPTICATTNLKEALAESDIICEAVPVAFLRKVLNEAKEYIHCGHRWIVLSKGIEQETLLLPTQIIDVVCGNNPEKAVLSGPSFARDLGQQMVTAVIIATNHVDYCKELQCLFKNNFFRPYISTDMIGVQVGGALKNVMALGIGFLDGAGYTDNAKAFIFTRGLQEMMLCAAALGGKKETLVGLAGVGDLFLTAMGQSSRNHRLGVRLGQGVSREAVFKELGTIPESVNTIMSTHQLMLRYNLDLPVLDGLYQLINGTQTLDEFFAAILERPIEKDCV